MQRRRTTFPAHSEPSEDRSVPCRHARTSRGFSLVEIMVALTIIGIVLAAAVPNFTNRNARYRVEGAAKEVGTRIALARQQAVAERMPYRMVVDESARSYYFEKQENDSTWTMSPNETYEIKGAETLLMEVGESSTSSTVRLQPRGTLLDEDAPLMMRFVSAMNDTAYLSVVRTGRTVVTMSQ